MGDDALLKTFLHDWNHAGMWREDSHVRDQHGCAYQTHTHTHTHTRSLLLSACSTSLIPPSLFRALLPSSLPVSHGLAPSPSVSHSSSLLSHSPSLSLPLPLSLSPSH